MNVVKIDTRHITDWNSFHEVFRKSFGFPVHYGHNMDAWIDCMSSLDDPGEGMAKVRVARGSSIAIVLEHVEQFELRCPELMMALHDATAFVNWRRIEKGTPALLSLAYFRDR